jgi:hypothetical protein
MAQVSPAPLLLLAQKGYHRSSVNEVALLKSKQEISNINLVFINGTRRSRQQPADENPCPHRSAQEREWAGTGAAQIFDDEESRKTACNSTRPSMHP